MLNSVQLLKIFMYMIKNNGKIEIKIILKNLKNRENLIHKIEDTFCNASVTHTDNERILEKSILKF